MVWGRSPGLSKKIIELITTKIPPKTAKREIISPIGISWDEVLFVVWGIKAVKTISQAGNAIEIQYNIPW